MAQAFFKAVIEEFEADDIRAFYDSNVFRVWHLCGKERTFRITKVARITDSFRGEVTQKALLYLEDRHGPVDLPFALNVTNRETIKGLYGKRPKDWVGRLITLFPTTTEVGTETKDCIRVRNYDPATRMKPRKDGTYTNRQGVRVLPAANERMEEIAQDLGDFNQALERNSTPASEREISEAEFMDEPEVIS